MKNKKKVISILIICAAFLIIIPVIGYVVLLKLNVFMKTVDTPPALYLENTVWGAQMKVGSLPQKTYYIGKIKKFVPSTEIMPEENFTTNCPYEGCNVYSAELSETVYIEYVDRNGVTRYMIFKKEE